MIESHVSRCALGRSLTGLLLAVIISCIPGIATAVEEKSERGEDEAAFSPAVARTLEIAGENRDEMIRALGEVEPQRRASLEFLIEHMPQRDAKTLSADFLLENVRLAHEARAAVAWGASIPEEVFLCDVLPYASLDESRDPWRKEFFERFLPLVKEAKTPGEAAQILNREVFRIVNVKYSTRRKRANQSPRESIETGLASCTGLSILLVDACRAVAVPARIAGTPLWVNKRGNHTWVEVWDNGWHFTGAAEPDARGLDHAWFERDASQAVADSRLHAIYATSFRKTEVVFPMVWARRDRSVSGVNVTERYTGHQGEAEDKGRLRLLVRVLDRKGGARVSADVEVVDAEESSRKLQGTSQDETKDTNDILEFNVDASRRYVIHVRRGDRRRQVKFAPSGKDQETVTIYLNGGE